MLRVPFDDLYAALLRGTQHLGLTGERAQLCARLFAETTRDGVYTHGLNRFPRMSAMVRNGAIDVSAEPVRTGGATAFERWDGHRGVGNLNAYAAMLRAMELARTFGVGGVALGNTNHWMRGGSYGWMAAEAGLFSMCWSNTLANLPPWGATEPAVGNNPLILAVPRAGGAHVVLDMAMSQFSYGSLAAYSASGKALPVPGGFDVGGNLTTDAAAIEASQRALPIGYWKGSGLSMVLDMFAAMLSGGLATNEIPRDPLQEAGISQFFLAVDPAGFVAAEELERVASGIIASVQAATPVDPARAVRYPGEQTVQLREENLRLGVPVDEANWRWLTGLEF
ncbi:MAG: 3-dehydro-L-gulonate 2-dehydrogenase [Acidobacteriaceae bacterium]